MCNDLKFLKRCGGLSPVPATERMTQPVGQKDGQLFTEPGNNSLDPVQKQAGMTQAVGRDDNGRLYTYPAGEGTEYTAGANIEIEDNEISCKIDPTAKTAAMTQAVGMDSDGRLFTQPSAGVVYTAGQGILISDQNVISNKIIPVGKTNAMTVDVGLGSDGKLYVNAIQNLYMHRITISDSTDSFTVCTEILSRSNTAFTEATLKTWLNARNGIKSATGYYNEPDAGQGNIVYGIYYNSMTSKIAVNYIEADDDEYTFDIESATVTDDIENI